MPSDNKPSDNKISRRAALRRTAALLGGVVSAPVWSSVLSGCSPSDTDSWTPVLFSPEQVETVAALADVIIPPTDTPGARAANAHRFIDAMVGEGFLADDRNRFLRGLSDFMQRVQDTYTSSFTELESAQQMEEVAAMDAATFGPEAPFPDPEAPSFYQMLKELVLAGYYNSEIGATQELKYNVVPGYYDGDVPFEEIGRAWVRGY